MNNSASGSSIRKSIRDEQSPHKWRKIKHRQSDARWRKNLSNCFAVLKSVVKADKTIHLSVKRGACKAKVLEKATEHLKLLESTVKALLLVKANREGSNVSDRILHHQYTLEHYKEIFKTLETEREETKKQKVYGLKSPNRSSLNSLFKVPVKPLNFSPKENCESKDTHALAISSIVTCKGDDALSAPNVQQSLKDLSYVHKTEGTNLASNEEYISLNTLFDPCIIYTVSDECGIKCEFKKLREKLPDANAMNTPIKKSKTDTTKGQLSHPPTSLCHLESTPSCSILNSASKVHLRGKLFCKRKMMQIHKNKQCSNNAHDAKPVRNVRRRLIDDSLSTWKAEFLQKQTVNADCDESSRDDELSVKKNTQSVTSSEKETMASPPSSSEHNLSNSDSTKFGMFSDQRLPLLLRVKYQNRKELEKFGKKSPLKEKNAISCVPDTKVLEKATLNEEEVIDLPTQKNDMFFTKLVPAIACDPAYFVTIDENGGNDSKDLTKERVNENIWIHSVEENRSLCTLNMLQFETRGENIPSPIAVATTSSSPLWTPSKLADVQNCLQESSTCKLVKQYSCSLPETVIQPINKNIHEVNLCKDTGEMTPVSTENHFNNHYISIASAFGEASLILQDSACPISPYFQTILSPLSINVTSPASFFESLNPQMSQVEKCPCTSNFENRCKTTAKQVCEE